MSCVRGAAVAALGRAVASSGLCAPLSLHTMGLSLSPSNSAKGELGPRSSPQCQSQSLRGMAGVPGAVEAEAEEPAILERTKIADILASKGATEDGSWLWCTTEDSVFDAVKSMTSHNVGALLVLKPGTGNQAENGLAGIITERDYLRKIIVQNRSSKTTKVGEIMTEENKLITVSPETKVLKAMELMTANRIRHIPVIENQKMKGMVSVGDVVKAVLQEHKEEVHRLNDYIKGTY